MTTPPPPREARAQEPQPEQGRADAPAAPADPGRLAADEPSPPVEPVVLRGPRRSTRHGRPPARRSAPPDENLVDAITHRVSALIEASLREAIHAAVLALAPRVVISLDLEPEQGGPAAQAQEGQPVPGAPVPDSPGSDAR